MNTKKDIVQDLKFCTILNDEVRSNDNGSKEKEEEHGKTLKEEKEEESGREWQDHFYNRFTKKY